MIPKSDAQTTRRILADFRNDTIESCAKVVDAFIEKYQAEEEHANENWSCSGTEKAAAKILVAKEIAVAVRKLK